MISYFHLLLLPFSIDSHTLSAHRRCLLGIWGKSSLLIRIDFQCEFKQRNLKNKKWRTSFYQLCLKKILYHEYHHQNSQTSDFYSPFPDKLFLNFLDWDVYLPITILLLIITAVSIIATVNFPYVLSSLVTKTHCWLNYSKVSLVSKQVMFSKWPLGFVWSDALVTPKFVTHRLHGLLPLEFFSHASMWCMCSLHAYTYINK